MKILYLLFPFLFLAFLSEPGNAQEWCRGLGGFCSFYQCRPGHDLGPQDCWPERRCCRWGK
uniref:Beta-defensin-like protein n=1 Tax=Lachesis muta TaxID=8752 RepID=M1KE79_LACMT|nr:beta-defensin-like protein [Lachesis muta]